MRQVTIEEAEKNLAELFECALNGEEIYIAQNGGPSVRLQPAEVKSKRPRFGSAEGLFTMSDDWDEPLEDFKDYM